MVDFKNKFGGQNADSWNATSGYLVRFLVVSGELAVKSFTRVGIISDQY